MTTDAGSAVGATAGPLAYRLATPADLPACEGIWRAGINGYLRRLGLDEVPADNPSLRRLHAHTFTTDPSRFVVATVPPSDASATAAANGHGEASPPPVAFGSAVRRDGVWFLSMLFVNPEVQAKRVGRTILEQILPGRDDDAILATVTDSAQPISNALYSSFGIVPRVPLYGLLGRPRDGWVPPPLPAGIRAEPLEGVGDAGFVAERDALDREVLGFAHPQDHAFAANADQRLFAYRDGAGALAGYGAASLAGRVGPIAVRDPNLLAPVTGHLLAVVEARGASVLWLPGSAGEAFRLALDAGLRIDGFPLLLCWSRPFADFARYLPISPGLL